MSRSRSRHDVRAKPVSWRVGAALGLAASLAIGGNCLAQQAPKIGLIAPVSGPDSAFGSAVLGTVRAEIDAINQQGGLNGRKIEFEVRDACDPPVVATSTRELVERQRVTALIAATCSIGSALPVAAIVNEARVPSFVIGDGTPQLTDPARPFTLRVWGRTDVAGEFAARLLDQVARPPAPVSVLWSGTQREQPFFEGAMRFLTDRSRSVQPRAIPGQQQPSELAAALPNAGPGQRAAVLYAARSPGDAAVLLNEATRRNLRPFTMVIAPPLLRVGAEDLDRLRKERAAFPGDAYLLALRWPPETYARAAVQFFAAAVRSAGSLEGQKIIAELHGRRQNTVLGSKTFDRRGEMDPPDYMIFAGPELRPEPAIRVLFPTAATAAANGPSSTSSSTGSSASSTGSSAAPSAAPAPAPSSPVASPAPPPAPAPPSPSPPPERLAPSVYNIEFDGSAIESRDPLVLRPQVRTSLQFSIGRPRAGSVLPPVSVDRRIAALAEGSKLPIQVNLHCGVCASDKNQFRTIEFDPAALESTTAGFEIVPDPAAVTATDGLGPIAFSLYVKGHELNRIHLEAFVGTPQPAALRRYDRPSIEFLPLPADPGPPADLVITIMPETTQGVVAVALNASLAELKEEIGQLISEKDSAGNDLPRKFLTTIPASPTQSALQMRAVEAYTHLRQIIRQESKFNEPYRRAVGTPTVLGPASTATDLTARDRDQVLNALMANGKSLYRALFVLDGHADLIQALERIERFSAPGGRPLRISIDTAYLAPWQLLYPNFEDPDQSDSEKFWGFKYEVAVRQYIPTARQRPDTTPVRLRGNDMVFARGQPQDANDRVGDLAERLMASLERRLPPRPGATAVSSILTANTADGFLDHLHHRAGELKLVFLFSHATSGTQVLTATDAPISVPDDIGPRLKFSNQQEVTPRKIEELIDRVRRPPPIWGEQPIFILNACETGTGGIVPANSGVFVSLLMRLGARAVIVTESEIWSEFASAWAESFLDELFAGHDMPKAVRNARRRHLEDHNNPLGLIYSLYGSPAARLELRMP